MSVTFTHVRDLDVLADALNERDRLIALVKRAPHANHCGARPEIFPGPCNCWKREGVSYGVPAVDQGQEAE